MNANDEKSCDNAPAPECDDKTFYKCKESTSTKSTSDRWHSLSQMFPSSCIPKSWKCDGEFDCPEKDDEENCHEITCGAEQFKCNGFAQHLASCIPKSWVCDGQSDCLNMEDEKNCTTKVETKTCADDEFHCTDGQCIFKSWKCDGEYDCKVRVLKCL